MNAPLLQILREFGDRTTLELEDEDWVGSGLPVLHWTVRRVLDSYVGAGAGGLAR